VFNVRSGDVEDSGALRGRCKAARLFRKTTTPETLSPERRALVRRRCRVRVIKSPARSTPDCFRCLTGRRLSRGRTGKRACRSAWRFQLRDGLRERPHHAARESRRPDGPTASEPQAASVGPSIRVQRLPPLIPRFLKRRHAPAAVRCNPLLDGFIGKHAPRLSKRAEGSANARSVLLVSPREVLRDEEPRARAKLRRVRWL